MNLGRNVGTDPKILSNNIKLKLSPKCNTGIVEVFNQSNGTMILVFYKNLFGCQQQRNDELQGIVRI